MAYEAIGYEETGTGKRKVKKMAGRGLTEALGERDKPPKNNQK